MGGDGSTDLRLGWIECGEQCDRYVAQHDLQGTGRIGSAQEEPPSWRGGSRAQAKAVVANV